MPYNIKKKESNVYGLSYLPELVDHDMDADGPPPTLEIGISMLNPYGFQEIDRTALKNEIIRQGNNLRYIFEIGVAVYRDTEISKGSTQVIIENKKDSVIYLGIDISNHGEWVNEHPNCHFMAIDSADITKVNDKMNEIGMKEIDLFLIDGLHSVNRVLLEWNYTKSLSKHGSVVMHDITIHPSGLVFDAIDDKIYHKQKYESPHSYGLGIARRF